MTRSTLRAVLFDVDYTLVKPGPDLGPEGYQRLGRRFGLELVPDRYREARLAAIAELERHPELDHDEDVWIVFTERIVRGMGGDAGRAHDCAVEMTRAWEHAHNFELYDDALPVLEELRGQGLKLGLVSNTGRDLDEFRRHHGFDVDCGLSSKTHGKTKPHPTIFAAALERLGVRPEDAAMVGDSVDDDVEGALAVGMQALLVDREGRYPEVEDRLRDLLGVPAALGLAPR